MAMVMSRARGSQMAHTVYLHLSLLPQLVLECPAPYTLKEGACIGIGQDIAVGGVREFTAMMSATILPWQISELQLRRLERA